MMGGSRRGGRGGRPRRGVVLAAILVIGAALIVFLFILYLRRSQTIRRIRTDLQRQRAYYLARAGAAQVIHKMERTIWVMYEMLRPGKDGKARAELVLPRDGKAFLDGMRDCKVEYDVDGTRGEYDVEEVRVRLILAGEGEDRYEALSVKIRCSGVIREGLAGKPFRKELVQSFVLKVR